MGRSAHSNQDSGPARQGRGSDHGDAEQDVTDHEQDCRQPVDDHHRPVLANRVEHCRRLLGQNRGEETEVPRHRDQIGASERGQEADQSQSSHPAALSRIQPGKAEQRQQPGQRVNHMRRDKPRLAGNNRRSRFTTGVQQGRDNHQHASSHQSHPAPTQQAYQPAVIIRHHRASPPWLANVGPLCLALLIAAFLDG